MTNDVMSEWVKNTKAAYDASKKEAITVVRREKTKTKGEVIVDIADRIWPSLMSLFEGVRDENGLLLQPSHVRGIALNVAQDLVTRHPDHSA